jgi:flavorubredoxin
VHNVKLFESRDHLFVFLNESTSTTESGIHSNQYLIKHRNNFVLLDPGGFNVMPHVLAELLRYTTLDKLTAIILSHQDPDVLGGIVSWTALSSASVYLPEIWKRFIPHCGITTEINRFYGVPDKGMLYPMASNCKLQLIPAHFLHSEGNINVYDPVSKILFSGDIGAATTMIDDNPFVENFKTYLPHIEGFHRRYMCSNRAIQAWLKRISKLEINMIAPQHGRIYKGKVLHQFIDWISKLQCGIDLFDKNGFIR